MFLLCQTQTPADHRSVSGKVQLGEFTNFFLRHSRLLDELIPSRSFDKRLIRRVMGGLVLDELLIDCLGIGNGTLQNSFGDPAQYSQVATDAGLHVARS